MDHFTQPISSTQDPYLDSLNCVDRLYREYLKYKKLFVAVDFDDTIYDFHNKGYTYPKLIDLVKRCQKLGFYITIFTGNPKEKFDFIREYCHNIGIKVDSINENPIPMPIGNSGKIYYNILLDDRAGLYSAYQELLSVVEKAESNVGNKQ